MSSTKNWLPGRVKWALLILMTIAWVLTAPFMLLAIGFSGGALIDPVSFLKNVFDGEPYALDQLFSILFLIFPLFLTCAFFMLTRKRI